ncbi:MAG: right-handed parallel beta-helix repeat-containing protein, partial [Candidatus Hodarchaeales archaeon]
MKYNAFIRVIGFFILILIPVLGNEHSFVDKKQNESITQVISRLVNEESFHLVVNNGNNTISIENNTDFQQIAIFNSWLGNGSKGNPYQINNLIFENNGSTPLISIKNTNLSFIIENCQFNNDFDNESLNFIGLYLSNVSNGVIKGNTFYNLTYGVLSHNSSYLTIKNNTFNQNNFSLSLNNQENVKIIENGFFKNIYGIYSELELYNSTISDNTIELSNETGIYLENATDVQLLNNHVSFSKKDGIFIFNALNVSLINGSIYKNALNGIEIFDSRNLTIQGLSALENSIHGINLDNSSNIKLKNNNIIKNELSGIQLINSSLVTIHVNEIRLNQYGLQSCNSSLIQISSNSINFNYVDGIFLNSSENIEILKNSLTNRKTNGINIYKSRNLNISENWISDSLESGILINQSTHISIINNTVTGDKIGIKSLNGMNNTIEWNLITGNSQYGIFLNNFSNYTLIQNNSLVNLLNIHINQSNINKIIYNNLFNGFNQSKQHLIESGILNLWLNNYYSDHTGLSQNNNTFSDEIFIINATNNVSDLQPFNNENPISPSVPDFPKLLPPLDIVIEEGSQDHQLAWIPSGNFSSKYLVLKNGTPIQMGLWENATQIIYSLGNDLQIGLYNFSIIINNTYNLWIKVDRWIKVVNTPELKFSNTTAFYVVNRTGFLLCWYFTDDNPKSFQIYRNNSLLSSNSWYSDSKIVIIIDGLDVGIYNYTIIVWDNDNLFLIDQVWVEVSPAAVAPFIINLVDLPFIYHEGNIGYYLNWTIRDDNPTHYFIYLDSSIQKNGSLIAGENIGISIDGLTVGIYNFTIVVIDKDQLLSQQTLFIRVRKTPMINSPADITFVANTTGHYLQWIATDENPLNYL